MIPRLPHWSWHYGPTAITLLPPEGPHAGGIRYRERVRPLVRLSKIVADWHAETPRLAGAPDRPRLLLTDEGEYAARVTARGQVDGAPAQRDLGVVFTDDSYAVVSALALGEAHFARSATAVDELVRRDSHMLGQRRRRFLYAPPPGWHGHERGFQADWYPASFPRTRALITVWPALPADSVAPAEVFELARAAASPAADRGASEPVPPGEPVHTARGLAGSRWREAEVRAGGVVAARELIVLQDARYTYVFRLEAAEPAAAAVAALDAVVDSVCPIPAPVAAVSPSAAVVMSHWT